MQKLYLNCQCDCSEHVLRFNLDDQDGDLVLETYLNHYHPWYQRIWIAIKYVFGHQSAYGAFDCTLLRNEDFKSLVKIMAASDRLKGLVDESPTLSEPESPLEP